MPASGDRGVSRVLQKLSTLLDNGQYYDAHQMYRTLYFRYKSSKKFDDARKLLYDGAQKMAAKNEYGSSSDLALLFVDILESSKLPITSLEVSELVILYDLIPSDSPDKGKFLNNAFELCTNQKSSEQLLHGEIGLSLWKIGDYVGSHQHLLNASNQYSSDFATMLVMMAEEKLYCTETDLLITLTLLQLLCLKEKEYANLVFQDFCKKCPGINSNFPNDMPILNFCNILLILASAHGVNKETYINLLETYRPFLDRDPRFSKYLKKIGQIYFGIPADQPQGFGGIFGNLMSSLMGGAAQQSEQPQTSTSTEDSSAQSSRTTINEPSTQMDLD